MLWSIPGDPISNHFLVKNLAGRIEDAIRAGDIHEAKKLHDEMDEIKFRLVIETSLQPTD